MDHPRYQHDCQKCKYLGQFEEYDFYWCKSHNLPTLDSILARYGSDGPEYLSSHPPGAFCGESNQFPWYVEILKRAEKEGLYDPKKAGISYRVVLGKTGPIFDQRGSESEALSVYNQCVEKYDVDEFWVTLVVVGVAQKTQFFLKE
jgi:hypothetical protein